MSASPDETIVVDLGFGDAGKGTIVDWLVRRDGVGLVVRFNGGAQAGHNVVAPDGTHHTFAQLGAGTLVPGVRTYLGPAFVLHPGALAVEARVLASKGVTDALDRLTVDPRALVISPFQQAAGRLREIGRRERHGSCGVGVGEAVGDALAAEATGEEPLRAGLLGDRTRVLRLLRDQQRRKRAELRHVRGPGSDPEAALLEDPTAPERVVDAWSAIRVPVGPRPPGPAVYEGAQGVLLDETWGFHPHTTWSDCTPAGALALAPTRPRVLGVVRAYATRHGEGPFPTEDPAWTRALPEPHNRSDGWQGAFRCGPLDLVLLRYAARIATIDAIAVTCLDRLAAPALCDAYEVHPDDADLFTPDGRDIAVEAGVPPAGRLAHQERLGRALRRVRPRLRPATEDALLAALHTIAPVWVTSHGPTAADKTN